MCERARHLPWPATSAPVQHHTVHSPGTEAKGYELFTDCNILQNEILKPGVEKIRGPFWFQLPLLRGSQAQFPLQLQASAPTLLHQLQHTGRSSQT